LPLFSAGLLEGAGRGFWREIWGAFAGKPRETARAAAAWRQLMTVLQQAEMGWIVIAIGL
jgi:hypothetical protein